MPANFSSDYPERSGDGRSGGQVSFELMTGFGAELPLSFEEANVWFPPRTSFRFLPVEVGYEVGWVTVALSFEELLTWDFEHCLMHPAGKSELQLPSPRRFRR
jgi:hypothetical protein